MLGSYSIGSRFLGSGRSIGTLSNPIEISGSATAAATSTVGITQRRRAISGAASAQATASGQIRVRIGLSGQASASASAQASLGARRALSGANSSTASGGAVIGARRSLAAVCVGRASGAMQPVRTRPVAGSSIARAASNIAIGMRRPISGQASAFSAASAAAVSSKPISGSALAVATSAARFSAPFSGTDDTGRIIYVEPKDPYLIVAPKEPIIVVVEDDRGIVMEQREKQPSEIVDYVLDMRDWFKKVSRDDYIASGVVSVEDFGDPADVEIGPAGKPSFSPIGLEPQMARIWIGGGRDGFEYKLTAQVTTNEGRLEEVDVLVIVREG